MAKSAQNVLILLKIALKSLNFAEKWAISWNFDRCVGFQFFSNLWEIERFMAIFA